MGGDGDADLVGDLDSVLAFEADLGEEELDVGLEALAEAGGEFGDEGDVAEEEGVPGFGEVGSDDFLLLGAVAAGEEVLAAEEEGGDADEDEEEDVGWVDGC